VVKVIQQYTAINGSPSSHLGPIFLQQICQIVLMLMAKGEHFWCNMNIGE